MPGYGGLIVVVPSHDRREHRHAPSADVVVGVFAGRWVHDRSQKQMSVFARITNLIVPNDLAVCDHDAPARNAGNQCGGKPQTRPYLLVENRSVNVGRLRH